MPRLRSSPEEKRAFEISHILDQMKQSYPVLQADVENSLIETISGKLVTVQERMLFGALLGEYKQLGQEFMETQEVSFLL